MITFEIMICCGRCWTCAANTEAQATIKQKNRSKSVSYDFF